MQKVNNIVLFPHMLYFHEAVLENNKIVKGWVVNGGWYFVYENEIEYALRLEQDCLEDCVNSWETKDHLIIYLDKKYHYDEYNKAIEHAKSKSRLNGGNNASI